MLTSEQIGFFAAFPDFTPDKTARAETEFARLVALKNWIHGSKKFRKCYRAFFKQEPTVNVPTIRPTLPFSTSKFPRQDTFMEQVEEELHRLKFTHSTSSSSMGTSTGDSSSADEDENGVRVGYRYFDTFPPFVPDNDAPIRKEFKRLAASQGWKENSNKFIDERVRCFSQELQYFCRTNRSDLEVLQSICNDLDVDPIPGSITACKKALKTIYVCFFDFIDFHRYAKPIKKFQSKAKLCKHLAKHGFFPKDAAKNHKDTKVLMQHMHWRSN